jgi:hypothetical protein
VLTVVRMSLTENRHGVENTLVDQFDDGYPRLTAIYDQHPPWQVVRKFGRLRLRIILEMQAKLAAIEAKLDKFDHKKYKLYKYYSQLPSTENRERKKLLRDAAKHLSEYSMISESIVYNGN